MKTDLYQIFYKDEQPLGSDCIHVDARGIDPFPLFENKHILDLYPQFEGADYYGITSWRMYEKTGLTKKRIDSFIAENPGYDAYLYGEYGNDNAFVQNITVGTPIGVAWKRLFELSLFKDENVQYDKPWIDCFCNYFIANQATWDQYMVYLKKTISLMDTDPILKWMMEKITFPHRGERYPLQPFILEYLFGLFLKDNKDISYKTIPNKLISKIPAKESLTPKIPMKVHIHVPKTGGMSFIDMWGAKYKTLCVYETKNAGRYTICDSSDKKDHLWDHINGEGFTLDEVCNYAKFKKYEVIIGNLKMDEADEILKKYFDVEYIAFIRNPFDRAYSEYCHNTSKGANQKSEESFYKDTANSMVKYLGKNLSKFSFIGVFETFSKDVARLGLKEIHDNKSEGKSYPRSDSLIHGYNKKDKELYDSHFRIKTLANIYEHHKTPAGMGDKGTLHRYIENYDKLFSSYRNRSNVFLEVGVEHGHSLRMWREYFPQSKIIGADIKESPKPMPGCEFYLCDQSKKESLDSLLPSETFDIIVDDGSHVLEHQILTHQCLFKRLKKGGIYIIEDIQNPETDIPAIERACGKCEIYDTRKESGRYDDILLVWRKT